MSRMKRRAEAELVLACAPIEDQLVAAKDAHAEEGTAESRQAKRAAMATTHETRAWLRAADELERLPREIAGLQEQLRSARKARDGQAAERVARLEARIGAAEARRARIQAQFGPLVQAMNELGGA